MAALPAEVFSVRRLAAVHRSGLLDTGPEEAFDRLARLATRVLDVPFAFVTIVDDRRSFWKSCVGVDSVDLADRQNTVEESFCQYVIGADGAVIIGDARSDARSADNRSIETMGLRAWAGFPVRAVDGQVLGTFCAVDIKPREWTDDQVDLLSVMALAAEGEIQLRDALSKSRQLVNTLQESLLPLSLPEVDGAVVAARHVAAQGGVGVLGDFYDVFESVLGRWHVVVGDVCGHGVGAAKTTGLARWTLHAAANSTSDPTELLQALNAVLLRHDSDQFLTAQMLTLDAAGPGRPGLIVDLGSAGHPPALCRRADGKVETIDASGRLIGMFGGLDVGRARVHLGPGDLLVLYTDGLIEARRDGQFIDPQQVVRRLGDSAGTPEAAVTDLIDLAVSWSSPILRDDLAVVAVGPAP